MHRRVPDTTKLHELIGWRLGRSLDQIVLDVAAHQRERPARVPPRLTV